MNSLPTSLAQFGPSPASAQKNDAADSEGMVGAFDLVKVGRQVLDGYLAGLVRDEAAV